MSSLSPHRQPVKSFYLTYQFFSTVFCRIPYWILTSIPRSGRPRPSWSIRKSVVLKIIRRMGIIGTKAGPFGKVPNYLAITPGVGVNGVWVEPTPDLVDGALKTWANVAGVSSLRIPGYWIHEKNTTIDVGASPMPGEKVVYALHGGAYVMLSAHPTDPTAVIARTLLKNVDTVHRVFSIEYRLATAKPRVPTHPFPTALLDALAGYNYLVNVVGFSPSDIIIEGDSAGGNLALALTRYLVEYQNTPELKLPSPPGGLLLLSPWTDLSNSHVGPGTSSETNEASDYLRVGLKGGISYAKVAVTGPHGMGAAETNRYISPASLHLRDVRFAGFPKTFIVAGEAEVLLDQIRTLRDRMTKDLGDQVVYHEETDAPHDFVCVDLFKAERARTLQAIAEWVSAM